MKTRRVSLIRRKPLLEMEVPESFRRFVDFERQVPSGKYWTLHLEVACPQCGQRRLRRVDRIREYALRGQLPICSHCWSKGGRVRSSGGYVMIRVLKGHPKGQSPYKFEHRLVMERMLGRMLEQHETVHHKNGDRMDNKPENLELWTTRLGKGVRDKDIPHCQSCTCRAAID